MFLSSLSTELRHEIYSYLIFNSPEPPTEPPIIHMNQQLGHIKGWSHIQCCQNLASPRKMHHHFLHDMTDPVQSRGSMLVESGTNRPYLSTPAANPKKQREICLGHTSSGNDTHGLSGEQPFKFCNINALLRTDRWLADDVRAWMYPRIIFDFQNGDAKAFEIFTARLMPWTRQQIRMLRISVPIYSYEGVNRAEMESHSGEPASPRRLENLEIRSGLEWKRIVPENVVEIFPKVHILHVILAHQSRRLGMGTALAAPVQDIGWREEALEPLLRFKGLCLKEVTVVVDNQHPVNEVWSGDPRIVERRKLSEWLRQCLLGEQSDE